MILFIIPTVLRRSLTARIFGGACATLLTILSVDAREASGPIEAVSKVAMPAAENEAVIKEGAELALQGKLQGGMAGIGGETTGWLLTYQTKAGAQTLQVDCSVLDATKIPTGAVLITGKIIKKNYIERGPTLILKATRIEKMS